MSIGTHIIHLRNQKGLTQQDLSERTGLAASYISRIENRHLEPRPQTLRKIAQALNVPMSELFQEKPAQLGTLQCLITSSGSCVMNLLQTSRGKHAEDAAESYKPRQLQLLRMANYLIQTADARVLDSLQVLLEALLEAGREKSSCGSPASPQPLGNPHKTEAPVTN
jgi:transcriptional regulator with XRE-family HTH domain